jgi:hypothetical protein
VRKSLLLNCGLRYNQVTVACQLVLIVVWFISMDVDDALHCLQCLSYHAGPHLHCNILPAAAPAAAAAGQTRQLPRGCELRGAAAVITADGPVTFKMLHDANQYNKWGQRGVNGLNETATIKRGDCSVTFGVAAYYNALCRAGGLHEVSRGARTTLTSTAVPFHLCAGHNKRWLAIHFALALV